MSRVPKNQQSAPPKSEIRIHWWHAIPVGFAVVGLLQFTQGILAAVEHYPGHFSFGQQYLSELGRSQNRESSALFARSLAALGVLLLPMFLTLRDHSGDADLASRVLGIASSCGLIGIGLTPYDRQLLLHLTSLILWISSMTVLAVYRIPQSWSGGFYSRLSIVIVVCLVAAIALYARASGTHSAPLMQKFVIVMSIMWGLELVRQVLEQTVLEIRSIVAPRRLRTVNAYLAKLSERGLIQAQPVDSNAAARKRRQFLKDPDGPR